MTEKFQNQEEINIDHFFALEDLSDINPVDLEGVMQIIDKKLKENSDALEDVRTGRMRNFPHSGIGLAEKPSEQVIELRSRVTPFLSSLTME